MFGFLTDSGFFDLFDEAADNMVKTAKLFLEMVEQRQLTQDYVTLLRDAEHKGDDITHRTMSRLDQTFITPFDREDIHQLISQLDEVVDCLEAAAKRMLLHGIKVPNEDIVKQARVALQIAEKLAEAVREVRHFKGNQGKLAKLLIEIHDLENRGDEHNHAALARLFEQNEPMLVLKWKEIYDLTEGAIDSCETVAHVITSIMMKNV